MTQPNILEISLQESVSFSHSRIVISRQDSNTLFHSQAHAKRGFAQASFHHLQSRVQKIETVESGIATGSDEKTYKAAHGFFSKPLPTQKKINGHALKKAVFEVKPCMDLRQVRRGRKVFQIPRVIPPTKRDLFGVRRLLSVCTLTNRQNAPILLRPSDLASRKKETIKQGNREQESVTLGSALPKQFSVPQNIKSNTTPFSNNKEEPLSQKSSLISAFKGPGLYTRATLIGGNTKASSFSLSSSLSSEIKACSRSRSRSIENKKRIYKTASVNRGCIRMAWWL